MKELSQGVPTPPFDLTDLFGNDRLVFENNFAGPTQAASLSLQKRAEELYGERATPQLQPNETEGEFLVTSEGTFRIDVELAVPVYDLEAAREIRGQLDQVTPSSTLTRVDVKTKKVGNFTDRNRIVLSEDLWMKLFTRQIFDLDERQEAELEADINSVNNIYERVDLVNEEDNFKINLRVKEAILQDLIEFGVNSGDIIREKLDAEIGRVEIAAGDNFDIGR